jgi:hypothetical protein
VAAEHFRNHTPYNCLFTSTLIGIFMHYDCKPPYKFNRYLENSRKSCMVKGFHIVAKHEWKMYRKVKYLSVFRVIECELHQEQYRFGIVEVAAHGPLGISIQHFCCCPFGHKLHFATQHFFQLITYNNLLGSKKYFRL